MTTAAAFIAAARSMLGTPYRHQGRLPGVALDCVGLPFAAAWECGLVDRSVDVRDYAPTPDGRSLIENCDRLLVRKRLSEIALGDLLVTRWEKDPQHFAIVADHPSGGFSVIHAKGLAGNGRRGSVIEHHLDRDTLSRAVALFRIPGMQA